MQMLWKRLETYKNDDFPQIIFTLANEFIRTISDDLETSYIYCKERINMTVHFDVN